MNRLGFGLGLGLILASAVVGCGDNLPCDPDAPHTICTIAGRGEAGYLGDNGPAIDADLYYPQDILMGPDGNLWISDFNNYLVREIDPDGTIHRIIGVPGLLGDSPLAPETTCPVLQAEFNHTPTMVLDSKTNFLYMASWHNSRIKRVDVSNPSAMVMENYAGVGKRTEYNGEEGPASEAYLDLPSSVAIEPFTGNITIMDQANMVIRQIDQYGTIHRIAGQCIVDDQVPCAPGQRPVACPGSTDKVTCGQSCDVDGQPNTAPCNFGYAGDGGPAELARIGMQFGQQADPSGRITYDPAGNLIFADTLNNRIRKIDTNQIITTIAGTGGDSYSGDGGPAINATMSHPIDVAVADDGSIYFTDTDDSCVRKIGTDGNISTVAGQCFNVNSPTGMCASSDNNCTPVPPSVTNSFSGDGGPPTEATLDHPYGIFVQGNKLYIADTFNSRIRVVNL